MHRSYGQVMMALALPMLAMVGTARGYVDLAPTLSKIVADSPRIVVVEVMEVDRAAKTVTYKEVKALKGAMQEGTIKHRVAAEGVAMPRPVVQFATPGARAVVFASTRSAIVCYGPGWYQVVATGPKAWNIEQKERPDLPLAYYGTITRLIEGVEAMLAGKAGVITVVAFGADNEGASFDLALNRQSLPGIVRLQRIRATADMPQTVASASANKSYYVGPGVVDVGDVPHLIGDLKSGDAGAKADAAEDLRSLGKKASAAVPSLKELLGSENARVRDAAASALLKIAPKDAGNSVEVLLKDMGSGTVSVRRDAAAAAGFAGAAGEPLAEKLAALLKDEDEGVRINALQSISMLGRAAATAAPAVMPLLEDPATVIDAADALGRIGPAASAALPKLAKLLESEQASVRWAAVRGMSQIGGPEAKPAVDYMIKVMPKATEVEGYNMMIYLSLLGPVAADRSQEIANFRIKNPVLPSATQWALAPEKNFPWLGGGGRGGFGGRGGGMGMGGPGGMADIGTMIYQAYVRELGDRLKPAALVLAKKIMDDSAGNVPSWGYEILNADVPGVMGILTPNLSSGELAMRERAAVALGYMGEAAAGAKTEVAAAVGKASNEQEKRLMEWTLRKIAVE